MTSFPILVLFQRFNEGIQRIRLFKTFVKRNCSLDLIKSSSFFVSHFLASFRLDNGVQHFRSLFLLLKGSCKTVKVEERQQNNTKKSEIAASNLLISIEDYHLRKYMFWYISFVRKCRGIVLFQKNRDTVIRVFLKIRQILRFCSPIKNGLERRQITVSLFFWKITIYW